MPELTPRIGLKKPLGNEAVSRAAYNEVLDRIDEVMPIDVAGQLAAQDRQMQQQLTAQSKAVTDQLAAQDAQMDRQFEAQDRRVDAAIATKQNVLKASDYALAWDGWTAYDAGTDDKWQQTIDVPGLLTSHNFSMTYAPASKHQCQAANVSALDTTENGKVTFVCVDKPDVDLAVRIEPREVNM